MTKTLSMKIKIPGLGISHDFLVPSDMIIHKVIALIVKILHDEYPEASRSSKSMSTLLQASSGLALDRNCTLSQIGINNGDTFILL